MHPGAINVSRGSDDLGTPYNCSPFPSTLVTSASLDQNTAACVDVRMSTESHHRSVATMPKYIFSCAGSYVTQDLGKDVKGTIGFGHQSAVSLPVQLASTSRFA
ncbi:hypothetical protein RND71_019559 [Anisodus tanguticus]|uniref:Uncharacterized protein n=1 Tax=Anisodus tanguticus TaxID=243964 RepID=A0AAE1V9G8_9SOLA|nr:hypothetical protein RND71_019559 [Anisodus tanguticus]